jgi:hypothetical protein
VNMVNAAGAGCMLATPILASLEIRSSSQPIIRVVPFGRREKRQVWVSEHGYFSTMRVTALRTHSRKAVRRAR